MLLRQPYLGNSPNILKISEATRLSDTRHMAKYSRRFLQNSENEENWIKSEIININMDSRFTVHTLGHIFMGYFLFSLEF